MKVDWNYLSSWLNECTIAQQQLNNFDAILLTSNMQWCKAILQHK